MDRSTHIYDFGQAGTSSAWSSAKTQSGSQIDNEDSIEPMEPTHRNDSNELYLNN